MFYIIWMILIVSVVYIQGVISREWQGVIYMILDLLEQFNVQYIQTVEVRTHTAESR